jgi:hypothetical protein
MEKETNIVDQGEPIWDIDARFNLIAVAATIAAAALIGCLGYVLLM